MSYESVEIPRALNLDLPPGRTAFFWGARGTGKTTLLRQRFSKSTRYDLLETDTFLRLSKEPFRLREETSALHEKNRLIQPVILDEIQKIPALLDEIHWLIENKKVSFILCGSSARKLKRSHANLLGGRAWRYELYPLTTRELGKRFDLLKALNRGLIPSHYLDDNYQRSVKSYIQDYLKEEIQYEGLVRSLPAFARFLDTIPFSNGELVNFSNIASECGVDSKTVVQYYRILEDTLLGRFLEPFRKRKKRQTIYATPKFYLFDVGIANYLAKRTLTASRGSDFGKAFEHFIFMELVAYRSYAERDAEFSFWRTKSGLEVDFVIGSAETAIEVKGTPHITSEDGKGLKAFAEEFHPNKSFLVCQEPKARKADGMTILPWGEFLESLWNGEIF